MNNLQTSSGANVKVLGEGELTQVVGGHDRHSKRGGRHEDRHRKNNKHDNKHGKQRAAYEIPFPPFL